MKRSSRGKITGREYIREQDARQSWRRHINQCISFTGDTPKWYCPGESIWISRCCIGCLLGKAICRHTPDGTAMGYLKSGLVD